MKRNHILIIFTFLSILISCKKNDFLQKTPQNQTNVALAEKFFTVSPSTDKVVGRVANFISKQNEAKGFVQKLIRFDGYAKWDNAYIQTNTNSFTSTIRSSSTSAIMTSTTVNNADTIVYIPLVPEGKNHVYSFIWAKINGNNVAWSLFSGRDYDTFPNKKVADKELSAEKIAMISMFLDYRTFGYTKFYLSDKKLFSKETGDTKVEPISIELITKESPISANGIKANAFYLMDVCYNISYRDCPYIALGHNCRGIGGTCDDCLKCTRFRTICELPKVIYIDEGEGGGGGPSGTVQNPPQGGGGGTGGPDGIPGNGDSPDDPCDINSPCGRQGWTAEEALARDLMQVLGLTFSQKNWLRDHPIFALDIRDYLSYSPTDETTKIDVAQRHIIELINSLDYQSFVLNYTLNSPDPAWKAFDNDFYTEDDEEDEYNTTAGIIYDSIPSIITLNNGNTVQVEFGYSNDLVSANQMVSVRLINALIGALNEAATLTGITKIHIKATTNGVHDPKSNHAKALAIDISRINDVKIVMMNGGTGNAQTFALQTAFENQLHRRENFGPNLKKKLGGPWTVPGHKDHIHFSVTGGF